MNHVNHDEDFDDIEVGLPETGVPLPSKSGFLGKLRRTLERLEVGMSLTLQNVTFTQEKYLRQRLPGVGKEIGGDATPNRYSIRVLDNKRNRAAKRTLRIFRIE